MARARSQDQEADVVKRSRSVLIAMVAVAATALLGCVPDPPPPTSVPTTLTVTIPNTAPEVTITRPTADVSVNEIDILELAATASDAEDGDLSAEISWTLLSAEPGAEPVALGTGAITTAGPLAPGTYTITASVTDSAGLTASDQFQGSVAKCVTTAVLTPGSGNKNKGPLTLRAAQSFDSCDRPLVYGWECTTTKNPQKCAALVQAANSGHMVEYTYDLEVNEQLNIALRACATPVSIPKCGLRENVYIGVEPIMGF